MQRLSDWQSQKLLKAAMSLHQGLVIIDSEARVAWSNPAVEMLLGWTWRELEARRIGTLLAPSSRGDLASWAEEAGRGRPLRRLRATVVHKDGSEREIEFELIPVPDSDGGPDGGAIVFRDVTEADVEDRELVRLRGHFNVGFVQGFAPQAFLDVAGRFADVNEAACGLLQQSHEQLVGRSALEFLDPLDPIRRADLADLPRGGQPAHQRHEVIVRDARGRQLPLLLEVTALIGKEGHEQGFACFATDLSDVRNAEQRLAGQESFYRALNRNATDLALVTDAEGNLVYVSPSVEDLLGYDAADVVASSGFDFVHTDDQGIAEQLVASALDDPQHTARAVLRVRHASGEWRWVEESLTNLLEDPDVGGLVANLRDVTERVEAQVALQRSEARYRAIAEAAHEGIIALDSNGDTMFANDRLAELVGYSIAEIYESGLWCAFDPDVAQRLHQRSLQHVERGPERYELPFTRGDGETRILSVSASPLEYDEGVGALAMVSDVTLERRAEEELRQRALRDSLTGLPNRSLLSDRLASAAARQSRFGARGLAMLFVDLDNMKRVNDRAGHACGDALLRMVGDRLGSAVRDVDTLARLGGDEFVILCEDVDGDDAALLAHRVQLAFAQPFRINDQSFEVTASIGVALSPPHDVADLLHLADQAMYQAKERSRGSFLTFDSAMARAAKRRTRLADDIKVAIANDELVVHYQPIVQLTDGRPQGVEALVRWRHPMLGMLPPFEVLAAARETGMESQIDAAVLAIACRDMARLLEAGALGPDTYVAVNVSAATASLVPLDVTVPVALDLAGLPARHLVIEVTETSVMADVERAAAKLRSLASTGVRIAVDDFGTGYSSLAYLHRLPLDILKIDRSFVAGLGAEGESTTIIRSVLGLAEALSLQVVAEGVETTAQATALQEMGCPSAQGYLWSPAVPVEDLLGDNATRVSEITPNAMNRWEV